MTQNYYIYSPFNGQAISSNCYCYRYSNLCDANCTGTVLCKDAMACNSCSSCTPCTACCQHTIVSGSPYVTPLDISAGYNYYIYTYLSSNIASVRISTGTVCLSEGGDINQGNYIEVFTGLNAGGTKLGTLFYAHITARVYNSGLTVINKGSGSIWSVGLGTVPQVPAGSKCYQSTHGHLEVKAMTGVAVTRNSSISCGTNVTQSSTAIYWWTF